MNFEPSAERGAALDQRMRERLADTLEYVFEEVGGPLDVDPGAASRTVSDIRSAPQRPNRFGAYYDMVLALEDDQLDKARGFARELVAQPSAAGTRIAGINDWPAAESDRYRRLMMNDVSMVRDPDPQLLADAEGRIAAAFELLDRGYPEMAGEIRELLREIVIGAGSDDPGAMTFDGASSYMLWGAILLNARGQTNVLDTAQALAHESGHNLLFGLCASGPLVENPDDELFSSPLRVDPRPMDGVVHATYVLARMHLTVERLLEAGVLDEAQTRAALTDLKVHREHFDKGDEIVRKDGRLTPLGLEVMESARSYMADATKAAVPA